MALRNVCETLNCYEPGFSWRQQDKVVALEEVRKGRVALAKLLPYYGGELLGSAFSMVENFLDGLPDRETRAPWEADGPAGDDRDFLRLVGALVGGPGLRRAVQQRDVLRLRAELEEELRRTASERAAFVSRGRMAPNLVCMEKVVCRWHDAGRSLGGALSLRGIGQIASSLNGGGSENDTLMSASTRWLNEEHNGWTTPEDPNIGDLKQLVVAVSPLLAAGGGEGAMIFLGVLATLPQWLAAVADDSGTALDAAMTRARVHRVQLGDVLGLPDAAMREGARAVSAGLVKRGQGVQHGVAAVLTALRCPLKVSETERFREAPTETPFLYRKIFEALEPLAKNQAAATVGEKDRGEGGGVRPCLQALIFGTCTHPCDDARRTNPCTGRQETLLPGIRDVLVQGFRRDRARTLAAVREMLGPIYEEIASSGRASETDEEGDLPLPPAWTPVKKKARRGLTKKAKSVKKK